MDQLVTVIAVVWAVGATYLALVYRAEATLSREQHARTNRVADWLIGEVARRG